MTRAIKLVGFRGELPRIIPRLLPDMAAQRAINVRLDDGGLTPFRTSVQTASAGDEDHQTIYKHGDTWMSWEGIVHAAPGPVADDRLYFTGDGAPKMMVGADTHTLALAAPAVALSVAPSGSGTGNIQTRLYVYTWVTGYGEESPPSPPSDPVDWQSGIDITLSAFAVTPADRNIVSQRIYRSQTGTQGTYFYLIAERAAGTGDFLDDIASDALQEPLPSADWTPPPDDLQGLIPFTNGMMVGFVGRELYFCEPYRPHAWPEKYVLRLIYEIVGLVAVGSILIVVTKGNPYLIQGTHPASMQEQRLESNFPCINARSIVDLGYLAAYATAEGLVVVRPDGQTSLVTANLFNRDDWLSLSPQTMIGCQIEGRYVAFYDATAPATGRVMRGSLIIDLGPEPYLIRSDEDAVAAHFDMPSSGLYFLRRGTDDIYRLDAPTGARHTMFWRSKPFDLPIPENFGAIKIDSDDVISGQEIEAYEEMRNDIIAANETLIAAGSILGDINAAPLNEVAFGGDILTPMPPPPGYVQVSIYADDQHVKMLVETNKPKRLPSGFKAEKWEIEVTGNVRVTQITVGKTMDDLRAAG